MLVDAFGLVLVLLRQLGLALRLVLGLIDGKREVYRWLGTWVCTLTTKGRNTITWVCTWICTKTSIIRNTRWVFWVYIYKQNGRQKIIYLLH